MTTDKTTPRYPTPEAKAKHAQQVKAWRLANPDKYRKSVNKNRVKQRASRSASDRKRRLERPAAVLFSLARKRAARLGLPFGISIEDVVIPTVCPVLGIPIIPGGPASNPNLPTLDRTVPELGYVKGNIDVISHRANLLKSNATLEEARLVLAYLERRCG